jgi:hypothetical protein
MRRMIRCAVKPLCLLLILSFVLLDLSVHSARAGMIGTEAARSLQVDQDARARVAAFLDRDDVRQAMVEQGVDPDEARARVAALSDAEVQRIAGQLDRLPAGAGSLGTIIGAAVFIFIVLLITDILGLTKVFSFTRTVR